MGSLTDGDIRRALLNGFNINDQIKQIINHKPKFLIKENYNIKEIVNFRRQNINAIPIVDKNNLILNILSFKKKYSYLPIDAVVMSGGLGSRLKPLTDNIPKSLLKVGNKKIIDYNIDRLRKFGVEDFWICINYLGNQIKDHFENADINDANLEFVHETKPLGTIGAVSKINNFNQDYILVTNSDILTNLDYEDFFIDFIKKGADMSVVTIPYNVDIPYAVIETDENKVLSFVEKPTYTYFSNGGIYLIKKHILKKIPKDTLFNSTDLMEKLLKDNLKLISYPMRQYWLDIGNPKDYLKAQKDIKHISL